MGLFKKGQALDTKNLKREKFPLPELGKGEDGKDCYVFVRAMSAQEVQDCLVGTDETKQASDNDILALCLVTDDGDPIFDNGDDVKANLKVSAHNLIALVEKIVAMSGMKKDRSKN